jgi:hypothetical protein
MSFSSLDASDHHLDHDVSPGPGGGKVSGNRSPRQPSPPELSDTLEMMDLHLLGPTRLHNLFSRCQSPLATSALQREISAPTQSLA